MKLVLAFKGKSLMPSGILLLAGMLAFVGGTVSAVEEKSEEFPDHEHGHGGIVHHLDHSDRLLDACGNVWPMLQRNGVELELNYLSQGLRSLKGGNDASQRGSALLGMLDFNAEINSKGLGWWDGGTLNLHILQVDGRPFSQPYAGVYQPSSWIEAERFAQIYELWFRQELAGNRGWVKLGKFEPYSDVASSETASSFTGAFFTSLGNCPLPTYPHTGMGALVGARVTDGLSLQGLVMNNSVDDHSFAGLGRETWLDDDGLTWLAEARWKGELVPGHETALRLGGWYSSGNYDWEYGDLPRRHTGNYGTYAVVDQVLYSNHDKKHPRRINLFTVVSVVREDRNETPWFWSGGLVSHGFVPGRPRDSFGIGFSNNYFCGEIQHDNGYRRVEAVTEIFYQVELFRWMTCKPFLQYVHQPADATANGNANHAVLGGIQMEMRF
jgi:porin